MVAASYFLWSGFIRMCMFGFFNKNIIIHCNLMVDDEWGMCILLWLTLLFGILCEGGVWGGSRHGLKTRLQTLSGGVHNISQGSVYENVVLTNLYWTYPSSPLGKGETPQRQSSDVKYVCQGNFLLSASGNQFKFLCMWFSNDIFSIHWAKRLERIR